MATTTSELRLNDAQCIALSVSGDIASPSVKQHYRIAPVNGKPTILPSVGGIAYNANLGDPCMGIMADHVEPGVSIRHNNDGANNALNTFACIGNVAKVISGEGKGLKGWVAGKHGGVEHLMIHMANPSDLEKLSIGDRFQIKAFGCGLQTLSHPDITVMNIDPTVLSAWVSPQVDTLTCPVTHIVPAHLLGAGLGEDSCYSGDVDIQCFDDATNQELGLDSLRFGDMVAMLDSDHRYGRIYRKGWVSIGVVVHSCCVQAGHGPGLTTLITGPASQLLLKQTPEANLKHYLPSFT